MYYIPRLDQISHVKIYPTKRWSDKRRSADYPLPPLISQQVTLNLIFYFKVHWSSTGIFGSALGHQEHQGNFNSLPNHGMKQFKIICLGTWIVVVDLGLDLGWPGKCLLNSLVKIPCVYKQGLE